MVVENAELVADDARHAGGEGGRQRHDQHQTDGDAEDLRTDVYPVQSASRLAAPDHGFL
jgi:hypothetical protein